MHPLPESSGVVLDAKQYRPSTVDQHATQINVAALADWRVASKLSLRSFAYSDKIRVNGFLQFGQTAPPMA